MNFSAGDETPVNVLATTESTLKWATDQLCRLIASMTAEDLDGARHVPKAVWEVNHALQAVVIGSNNVDKLCKQAAGSFGTGAIDLHDARDEIGRRLARLRDAGPG